MGTSCVGNICLPDETSPECDDETPCPITIDTCDPIPPAIPEDPVMYSLSAWFGQCMPDLETEEDVCHYDLASVTCEDCPPVSGDPMTLAELTGLPYKCDIPPIDN